MTKKEVIEKRNKARAMRKEYDRKNTPEGLLNAEYNWGYWDAVYTIMDRMGLKEIENKAVQ